MLAVAVFLVAHQFYAATRVHMRMQHSISHVTTQGTVTRVKEKEGGRVISLKVFAWLQFDEDIRETQTSVNEHAREAMAALFRDDSDGPPESDLLHAVITAPEDHVRVGDKLQVVLFEGDPSRGIYLPYQKRVFKKLLFQAVPYLFIAAGILLVLKWSMDVPILFATSDQIEQAASESSFCRWLEYDDDEVERNNHKHSCCTIPWHVALAYDLCVSIPVVFVISTVLNIHLKVRRLQQAQRQAAAPNATTELTPTLPNIV
jgi:ABC-type multidrug transport system fused ATPase/permease subunit